MAQTAPFLLGMDEDFRASNGVFLSFLHFLHPLVNHVFGFMFRCLFSFCGCVFGFHFCVSFLRPSLLLAKFLFLMACLLPSVASLWLLPAIVLRFLSAAAVAAYLAPLLGGCCNGSGGP
ncbi:hypothetical protein ACFX13_035478 [Malus domestica]